MDYAIEFGSSNVIYLAAFKKVLHRDLFTAVVVDIKYSETTLRYDLAIFRRP